MKIKLKEDQIVDPSVVLRRQKKIIMGARGRKLVDRAEDEEKRVSGYNSQIK